MIGNPAYPPSWTNCGIALFNRSRGANSAAPSTTVIKCYTFIVISIVYLAVSVLILVTADRLR